MCVFRMCYILVFQGFLRVCGFFGWLLLFLVGDCLVFIGFHRFRFRILRVLYVYTFVFEVLGGWNLKNLLNFGFESTTASPKPLWGLG